MFDDDSYNRLLNKAGLRGSATKMDIYGVLIAFVICWLPIAIITFIKGTFWTGDVTTSFITDLDVQSKFFISMPIFILSARIINSRLTLILGQFTQSGIVEKEIHEDFENIIKSSVKFLRSKWTDVAILAICYLQFILVLFYESSSTSVLSWQIIESGGETVLNAAGKWYALIGGPFILFLFYRWLLRIVVWGIILYKISRLKLTLYPVHPDLAGGLGFLGYSIRYFSPVAFAISATVAGNMADFMLVEHLHLIDLRFLFLGYFIFISFLFTFPLFLFSAKLINAREESVFENYDYTNGIYRELRTKISKGFNEVNQEDLKLPDFSAAADLSAVIENALKMKLLPFNLKDIVPLWVMTAIPFIGVVLIEIPVNEIFKQLLSLIV